MTPSWYMYGTEGTSFVDGRTSLGGQPGAHGTYFRAGSNELFTPPYTWTMRMKVRERLQPFKLINGVTVDWYNPSIVFFPMHLHDEGIATCTLFGLGGGTNEDGYQTDLAPLIGTSAKKKDPPPRGSYGVTSGYESRFKAANFDPCDGEFHDVRIEVLSHSHYQLWWDDERLLADVVEREPATMSGKVGVGLRLDFYDVEIQDEQVIEETMTEFVPIHLLAKMYREAGLKVNILAGAETRGARMYKYGYEDVRGLDKHHTAQHVNTSDASSIAYMTFNAPYPVITNVYPHKDDPYEITICAAGPSYTAGRGGPLGTVPLDRGNKYYWSWECPNNGTGERWSKELQETMVIGAAVETEFFSNWGRGWPEKDHFVKERIPSHFEWTPGRKVDPSGPSRYTNYENRMWDMYMFRRDVSSKHAELYGNPIPPPEDDDMPKICAQSRVDSRSSAHHQTLRAGETRELWLTLPAGAVTAVINVVILPKDTTSRGWVSVGGLIPTPSSVGTTVNWNAGDTIAQDQMTVLVTEGKKIYLSGNRDAEFVVDVTGLYW